MNSTSSGINMISKIVRAFIGRRKPKMYCPRCLRYKTITRAIPVHPPPGLPAHYYKDLGQQYKCASDESFAGWCGHTSQPATYSDVLEMEISELDKELNRS